MVLFFFLSRNFRLSVVGFVWYVIMEFFLCLLWLKLVLSLGMFLFVLCDCFCGLIGRNFYGCFFNFLLLFFIGELMLVVVFEVGFFKLRLFCVDGWKIWSCISVCLFLFVIGKLLFFWFFWDFKLKLFCVGLRLFNVGIVLFFFILGRIFFLISLFEFCCDNCFFFFEESVLGLWLRKFVNSGMGDD